MIKYLEGEVYYRLTFPDVSLRYPSVETFVFLGKNLSGDDNEDTWYFQFANDYGRFGSVLETEQGDRRVCCVSGQDVSDLLDMTGLIDALKGAAERRCSKRSLDGA